MNFLSISWWRKISQKMGRTVGWGCLVIFGVPLVIGFSWWGSNQYGRGGARSNQVDEAGVILIVNGDQITQKDFALQTANARSAPAGKDYAGLQGQILYLLIQQRIVAQMAKALNVRPNDADIDREIAKVREEVVGAKGTQADWDSYLDQRHVTSEDLRQQVGDSLLVKALEDHYKQQEKVTPEEAKNQSAEVKMNVVLIPAQSPPNPNMPFPPDPKALSDAAAKKKAEDQLAQVRAGADIAKIANDNAPDKSMKNGGDSGYMKEFGDSPLSFYGKEFADAVRQTQKGQLTPVIKTSGFRNGYAFARVTDRRNNLPKDYDEKKVIEQLQSERAQEKLVKEVQANFKAAKIQFGKGEEDKKAYYDFFRAAMMDRQLQMSFGMQKEGVPTAEEVATQKALADSEIEGVYQRHAKDGSNDGTSAALLVAQELKTKYATATPAEQPQMRDRLITLYETALRNTEDRQMRFDLANYYREKNDLDSAEGQLKKIASQLASNPPFDLETMQDAADAHQKLLMAFNSLNTPHAPRPSAVESAKKEQDALNALKPRILKEQLKAAEEERKRKAAQPAGTPGLPNGLTLPGGGAPGPGTPPPGTAPTTGGTTARPAPGTGASAPAGSGAAPTGGANKPGAASPAPKSTGTPSSAGQPGTTK